MRLNRAIAALVLLAGCLFVVLVQAQGTTAAGGGAGTAVELPAFGNITSCLPLNVLVKPSAQGSSNAYSLATDAGAEVAAALRAVVVNGTLFLGFNKSFESTTPIRVTVSLPADKLQTVENKGVGQLIINPGFKTTSKVTLTTSSGRILARDLSTPQLVIKASGVAVVFALGDIQAAQVTADGTSTVTLSGVTKTVDADLSGISKLYVDAASDAVVINPSADGLSKVYYNKGKCDSKKSKSMFMDMGFFSLDLDMGPFGSSCVQLDDPEDYPSYAALWSCGLRVRGTSVCAPGDIAAQEAARDATVISVASADSARGSSQASASATGASPATASSSSSPPPPTPTPTPTPPPTPSPKEAGPTFFSTNPQPSKLQGEPEEAGAKRPTIDRLAADIRVAAAGKRRRLSSIDHWLFGGDDVMTSSSSSSSSFSGDGRRRSEAVAAASLDCNAPDTERFIAA